ncbi:MAG: hypothetical protein V4577_27785 [Bacteroidota bacterium]
MENAVFIVSHLIMLFCAVLVFYNSAAVKTASVKAERTVIKPAKTSIDKIDDKEFTTELKLTPRLLQA